MEKGEKTTMDKYNNETTVTQVRDQMTACRIQSRWWGVTEKESAVKVSPKNSSPDHVPIDLEPSFPLCAATAGLYIAHEKHPSDR